MSIRRSIGKIGLTMSLIALVLTLAAIPSAQAQSALSAKGFVQSFYTWYIPQMTKNVPIPSDQRILKERASSFSPILLAMLKEDMAASAKVTDEIVGLDFDPFINGQDTPERYLAGKVIPKDKCYWVEVFDVSGGKKGNRPAVTPEVKFVKGQWIFTNFHYGKTNIPENENLISVLKALKASRLQYDKEHKNHSSIK